MKYSIGNTIKSLRHRDGRTQEDLATALGVTCQAVSRWESGVGYPDTEFLPAIANFFHVTIDRLFGYDDDREKKVASLLQAAEASIVSGEGLEECITFLREGVREFPTEHRLLLNLSFALRIQGERVHGTKFVRGDDDTILHEDTDTNSANPYFTEFCEVCERLLEMNIPIDDREVVIALLAPMYSALGMKEKTVALAQSQLPIVASREVLLSTVSTGEGEMPYQGQALIALLFNLSNVLLRAATTNIPLLKSGETLDVIRRLGEFIESLFPDGRCGQLHLNLKIAYMNCVVIAASHKKMDEAEWFLESAAHHAEAYAAARKEDVYRYTAPLFSGVTFPGKNFGNAVGLWKKHIPALPDGLRELLQKDERYAALFDM